MAAGRHGDLVHHLCETVAPLGDIQPKRLFGGHGIYLDGVMFALVTADDTLYLRTDDGNRPAFEDRGLAPFRPWPDKPTSLPYHPPPDSALDDPRELLDWARAAVSAARRVAATKKPSKPRKTRP